MRIELALHAVTAASGAVFAGSMFAFSAFVLPALRTLPAPDGIAAMQAINVAAPRSLLMLPMGLLAAGSATVLVRALTSGGTDTGMRIGGAALGLLSVGITVAANVPLNNRLADLPATVGSAPAWAAYVQSWAAWNHGRVLTGLASAALLAWAAARS